MLMCQARNVEEVMNIFIADDDEIIRKGLRSIIEKSGLNCTVVGEASDGELALQYMEGCGKVDLLITDIRMPIMDGLELIKNIKNRSLSMKVIVLSGYDEFKYIRNAFVDGAVDYLLKPINKNNLIEVLKKTQIAIEQEEMKENYRKESNQILVANTLKQIFQTPIDRKDEKNKILNKFGLNLEIMYYFVMIFRIDNNYKLKMERMEYEGILDAIYNTLVDNINDTASSYHLLHYIDRTEIVCLLYSKEQIDATLISEEIYTDIRNINIGETTYTLGISNVYQGMEYTKKTYQEALTAADARFYLGKNHLIEYSQIEKKITDFDYNIETIITKLIQYIELYDYIACKKVVDQMFLDLSYINTIKFRRYMREMVDLLILRVKDFKGAVLDSDYEFFIENINTYNELKNYTNSLLKDAIMYIRSEREKRSEMRIELAKRYIEENYKENITLNDVAEHVELNSSYLSNLFKNEVGVNFSDYLLNVRMQAARKLLKDPTKKIYEIGNLVGYEDAVSFGRAFKKKVGMSPKTYRNTVY